MTQTTSPSHSDQQQPATPFAPGPWERVLALGAWTTVASSLALMLIGRFVGPSLVVLDLAMVLGLVLMRRGRRRGAVAVLAIFSLANLLLHGSILLPLLRMPEAPATLVAGVGQVLSSVLVLAASWPAWRGRPGDRRLPARVRRGVLGVLVVALVVGLASFLTRGQEPARPGDVRLTTSGTSVDTHRLQGVAGVVTVAVRNDDPVAPRSFDVEALDVHVLVPPLTTRRVRFTAQPGTYRFTDFVTATDATSGSLVVRSR